MNPRLIAISGPHEGRTFPLEGETFSVGRHASNDLAIASLEVSRRHCELRLDTEGRHTAVDLGSRHGLFVNGRPTRKRRLEHSDLVTIGGTVLLYLLDDSSSGVTPPSRQTDLTDSPLAPGSTVARKLIDTLYFDRARIDSTLPAQARVAHDLSVLLQLSATLQGALSIDRLGKRLLSAVLKALPFDSATVLLREPGSGELTPTAALHRDAAEPGRPLRVSSSLVREVLQQKSGLMADPQAPGAAPPFLCAPLLDHDGEVLGLVYGENRSRQVTLLEDHLDLLIAMVRIASLAYQNALHLRWLRQENRRLREDQLLQHDMVGESPAMQRLFDLISRVSRADTTVLIRGESGTGKELTARAIHRSSPRGEAPFVAINCATLSETLLESELFGHEKGAFTGAVARKIGKIEAARGGTLFLDEVGEIPPIVQAKLLRVLQERELERVGGTRPIQVDVRIIAATNRDLEAAIRGGTFREDLYYRLKVITLEPPPLRQRRDDIPLLASHFIALHGKRLGRHTIGISEPARACLMAYPWPGNVRELGNVIERALVLGDSDLIRPEDLPDEVTEGGDSPPSDFQADILRYKKKLILEAYRQTGGYSGAAERLGVHVNSLHRLIRKLGLKDQLDP